MKKRHVILEDVDKKELKKILSKGSLPVKVFKRAMGLIQLDEGQTYAAIGKLLDVSYQTASSWASKYKEEGLTFLEDKPRLGRPITYDGESKAKITALACSNPPEGYGRWTLRLLAEHLVELELLPNVSYSEVRRTLKKTNYNLTEKNNGV